MRVRPVHTHVRSHARPGSHEPPVMTTRPTPHVGLEVRQLRYLVALSEEQNMTRAAVRLHLTQPALSQALHNLELRTGLRMFDRVPRGIQLTGPGEAFIGYARAVVAAVDAAEAAASQLATQRRNQLLIAFTTGLMALASRLVCSLRSEDDSLEIRMKPMSADKLADGLASGTIDVGLDVPSATHRRRDDHIGDAGTAGRVDLHRAHTRERTGPHPTYSSPASKSSGPGRELTQDCAVATDQDCPAPEHEPITVEEAWPDILTGKSIAVVPTFVADRYAMAGVVARHCPTTPEPPSESRTAAKTPARCHAEHPSYSGRPPSKRSRVPSCR